MTEQSPRPAASAGFVFIVNPQSAGGATRRVFERVRGRYQAALPSMEVLLTERRGHATELARRAVRAGAEAVVSVGGDGTNNEIINGFFEDDGTRIDSNTAFGVVTSGTGGDFRRTFGWEADPLQDLARLERNERRRIDVGRARFTTDDGRESARMFLNIAGFGLSGDVVERVNNSSKPLGGKASFFVATVRSLLSYHSPIIHVDVDDQPRRERRLVEVAVANGRFFGGGMKIAPDAEVDDGRFDLVMVTDKGFGLWVRHGMKIYGGTHTGIEEVEVVRCAHVRAEAPGSDTVPVELDGEGVGRLPLTVEVVPACVDLLV